MRCVCVSEREEKVLEERAELFDPENDRQSRHLVWRTKVDKVSGGGTWSWWIALTLVQKG